MKSRFSRRSEEFKARRSRRRRAETGMSPEQLEKRQMMAVSVFGDTARGGWLTIVAEDGDNVFVQKVATAPESLWVADNSSFANQLVVGGPRATFGPLGYVPPGTDIDSIRGIHIASGTERTEDQEVQFTGYPMTAASTTRFTLPSDGLWWTGPGLLVGPTIGETPLAGTVSIEQPSGEVSTWIFNNYVDLFNTTLGVGDPVLVSGVGVDQPVPNGFFYPTAIRAIRGTSAASKSQIEVQWNVPQLTNAPRLNVNEWYRWNSLAFPAGFGPQPAVLDIGPASPRSMPNGTLLIQLPNAAGLGLNPIIPSTFFADLLTLEKKIHGRWAGWPIPDACHTAENEKTRKRAG